MRGLYWEDWEIGAEFESPARTVTETDMMIYAGLSGDYNPLHVNEEYCKTTPFGTRIVHGPLVYAIAAGLIFQLHLYDDTLIAFLGFDSLKFHQTGEAGRHDPRPHQGAGEARNIESRPRRHEARTESPQPAQRSGAGSGAGFPAQA